MKKTIRVLLILSSLLLLAGCNKKEEQVPISIGNIDFKYNINVWGLTQNENQNAPLELYDKYGNTISFYVSQESTYQHPMEMISFIQSMASTIDQYEVFLEPTKIDVNGTTWYEFGYSCNTGDTIQKVYQRYYGKNYIAASISYTSTKDNYNNGYKEALKVMSDVHIKDVLNDVNEAKAKDFLVGEWDLNGRGYLVINDDNTYQWYKDNTKDKSNMHYGTFGADVENATLSLNEGDGIYLAIFPEGLVFDGVDEESSTYKIDYIISFDNNGTNDYEMVNMSTYNTYTLTKQ